MVDLSLKCRRCGAAIQVTTEDQQNGNVNCPKCGQLIELAGDSPIRSGHLITMVVVVMLVGGIIWGVTSLRDLKQEFIADIDAAADRAATMEASPELKLKNQLRTIAIAMLVHAESDRRRRFLPESTESWRVALSNATNQYESNGLRDTDGKTRILLLTGPGTLFDEQMRDAGSSKAVEMANRSADTIPLALTVGPDRAVPVEESRDFVFNPSNPKAALGDVGDSFLAVMADGSIHQYPADISPVAFTVLCQIEPQVHAQELASAKAELDRLGLPSELPERRPSFQERKSKFE